MYNPIDLLKVRAQVNRNETISARALAHDLIRQEGLRGLYKGFIPSLLIYVPGTGTYFWAFECLKNAFSVNEQFSEDRRTWWTQLAKLMVAGGVAGQVSWLVIYPFDVIKTQLFCERQRHLTIRQVVRDGLRTQGVGFFFKGLGHTLSSTFIYNSFTLPAFELVNRALLPKD